MLAEYSQLKSEMQYRSQFQNSIIQIHVTVLIAIIGAASYGVLNYWITLLLIPITSSIFGMTYFDHALTNLEIGTYIRERIEPKIQKLADDSCIMRWEKDYKAGIIHNLIFRAIISWVALLLTFGGPSILCIAGCSYYIGLEIYHNLVKILLTSTPTPNIYVLKFIIFTDLIFFLAFVCYVLLIGPFSNKSRLKKLIE